MFNNTNYHNLSHDELIAIINKKETELANEKEKVAIAEDRAEKAEAKAMAAEEKASEFEQRYNFSQERLHNIYILLQDRRDNVKEMFKECKRLYLVFDKITFENMESQLGEVFDEYSQWVLNASQYRDLVYGSGNDLNKSSNTNQKNTSDNKEEDNKGDDKGDDKGDAKGDSTNNSPNAETSVTEILQNDEAANSCIKKISIVENFINRIDKVIKNISTDEIPKLGKEIHHISETKEGAGKKNNPKPSPGRQRVDRTIDATILPDVTDDDKVCSACGSKEIVSAGTLEHKLFGMQRDLAKVAEFFSVHQELLMCNKCGHVHVAFGKDADLPIQPDREISVKLALHCIDAMSNGIPLNRIYKYMADTYHIGHSTLQKNIHIFICVYLVPFRDFFYERAKKAQHLLADGTPFPSLENKGLGNCMNKNPDRRRNHNEPEALPVDEGRSNYLLCCCNVPEAKEPFITYYFLPTRSYAAIEKVLTTEFSCAVLVTDAFQAYDKLATKRNWTLQNCITHFRRYIIRACDPEELANELMTKEEQVQNDFLTEMLRSGNSRMLLCCVFLALSKIYSYESSFDRSQPGCQKQILEIRQSIERPLMDDIDAIMSHLVDKHTSPAEKGEGRRERKGDPYSKAAIYWYNNHTKLRAFLDDSVIPPDTNKVEQSIRPVTIIRKNSYFMTSQDGMYDLCTLLTVTESLKRNGVKNPAAALQGYCRALSSHCHDEGYTKLMKAEGFSKAKKITSWDMYELSKNFDFQKHIGQILNL